MMEQYKNLWISGRAIPGYPAGGNLTPGAIVSYQLWSHRGHFPSELTRYSPELLRELEETEQSRESPYRHYALAAFATVSGLAFIYKVFV